MIALQVIYAISALALAAMGFNALLMCGLYLAHRRQSTHTFSPQAGQLYPRVVVQLPIYNERHVVERLVEAASQLDYPRDRLLIQLLDDSSDETLMQAAAAVEAAQASGVPIRHIQRGHRHGFKAGALAYGLELTDADLIAVFDADFVPRPDFLRRLVPWFVNDPSLGMIQTRWSHLNADYNLLTRAQALALDAHFIVEQTARHRAGLLMNFSGTGGMWRRACVEDSGGWQADTLSEDIDLSYRAQLRGWRCLYLPEIDTQGEIPPFMMAFKRQQARWATGTIQCLRKLGGSVLRARLNMAQKAEAMFHLGGYFIHPLMLLILLLSLPLLIGNRLQDASLAGLGLAMFGMPAEILIAQHTLHRDWKSRLVAFPLLVLLGMGIAVSNTLAVVSALSGRQQAFMRTPKFSLGEETSSKLWERSHYNIPVDRSTWLEFGLAVYAAICLVVALQQRSAAAFFMALYMLGFGYVSISSLWQARHAQSAVPVCTHNLSFSGNNTSR